MYKRNSKKKLGVKASHRGLLIKNMVRSLFKSGVIVTTTSRAKVLKQNAEALIVRIAKLGNTLNAQREMNELLGDRKLVDSTFAYLSKGDAKVKIVKVGFRPGDNAEKTKVELTGFKAEKATKKAVKSDKKEEEKKVVKTDTNGVRKLARNTRSVGKAAAGKKERSRTRSGL